MGIKVDKFDPQTKHGSKRQQFHLIQQPKSYKANIIKHNTIKQTISISQNKYKGMERKYNNLQTNLSIAVLL